MMPWARVLRFFTSGPGLVLLIALALFTWHRLDRSSAVREAVVGYVAGVELAAKEAEARVLRQRAANLQAANRELQDQIEQDERETADVQDALREYVESNPSGCVVSPDLLDRLRWD